VANKTKRAMSSDTKAKARARKEPATKARKSGRRVAQEMAASLNRVRRAGGELTPWEQVKVKRLKARVAARALRHGVSGAA
jgi:hypothetical protein